MCIPSLLLDSGMGGYNGHIVILLFPLVADPFLFLSSLVNKAIL